MDLEKLGYRLLAFVNLAMSPEQKTRFSAFAKGCPNVLECHHISGNYSMLLKVCFPGTPELDEFVGALQQFGTTQTQVVFSTLVRPRRGLWAAGD